MKTTGILSKDTNNMFSGGDFNPGPSHIRSRDADHCTDLAVMSWGTNETDDLIILIVGICHLNMCY
jgi:hypothetical protein